MKTKKKYVLLTLTAILCLQFLFLVYMNLFQNTAYIDCDAAKLYRHAIEIFRNGTLLVPNWKFITTMELDCSLILAVPFYGITKNIFLSFGLANIIFLLIFLFVIFDILKKCNIRMEYRLLSAILFLIPYQLGQLDYLNMMLYNGGQYVIKALVPLLAIDFFVCEKPSLKKPKTIVLLTGYFLLTFLTGLSSGTYVLLCGILPVFLCYIFNIIWKGNLKQIEVLKAGFGICSILVSLLGIMAGKLMNAVPRSSYMGFIRLQDLINNIITCIQGFFYIFLPNVPINVLSGKGIDYLIRFCFVIILVITIGYHSKKLFLDDSHAEQKRFLLFSFIWIFIILSLTYTNDGHPFVPQRYFFISIIPVFMLFAFLLQDMEQMKNQLLQYSLFTVLVSVIGLMIVVCDFDVLKSLKTSSTQNSLSEEEIDTYRNVHIEWDEVKQVCDFATASNYSTVLFLNGSSACEVARVYNPDGNYGIVDLQEDGSARITTADFYQSAEDRAYYNDNHLLAVKKAADFDSLPDYILSSYVEAGTVPGFTLYASGPNKYDNLTGFPLDARSIDFCNSPGYQYLGEINLYGYLDVTGSDNYVLTSPALTAPKEPCSVTLSYSMSDSAADTDRSIGTLQLLDASLNVIASAELNSSETAATLISEQSGPCSIAVFLNANEQVTLQQITYEKQ